PSDVYVFFNPNEQVRSADSVTYDTVGNIIPLSERFRTDRTGDEAWKNDDIRYHLSGENGPGEVDTSNWTDEDFEKAFREATDAMFGESSGETAPEAPRSYDDIIALRERLRNGVPADKVLAWVGEGVADKTLAERFAAFIGNKQLVTDKDVDEFIRRSEKVEEMLETKEETVPGDKVVEWCEKQGIVLSPNLKDAMTRYFSDAEKVSSKEIARFINGFTASDELVNTRYRSVKPKNAAKKAWQQWRIAAVDAGAAVYDVSKETGDRDLYYEYNRARASSNAAAYMIEGKQTDVNGKTVGKGLNEIFLPIIRKGEEYYKAFQDYLFHKHNQSRMTRRDEVAIADAKNALDAFRLAHMEMVARYNDEELHLMALDDASEYYDLANEYVALKDEFDMLNAAENYPVFGELVDAETSRIQEQALLDEHPEFAELAEEVYIYLRNLNQRRVDTGLISQEFADALDRMYPYYVPTDRIMEGKPGKGRQSGVVAVGTGIKRAEGGGQALMPIYDSIARRTMAVCRNGAKNMFGNKLLDMDYTAGNVIDARKVETAADPDARADEQIVPGAENHLIVYKDGEMYDLTLSNNMFKAVKALNNGDANAVLNVMAKANNVFKALCTSLNPFFALFRNPIRDFQEAIWNSVHPGLFFKNLPRAYKEILSKGDYWNEYQAAGGVYASYYGKDAADTTAKLKGKAKRAAEKMSFLSDVIEQAPRLAEYISSRESGSSISEALYNANEVTTNFGRSGTVGRVLNRSFVPFLNPGIQGFSKLTRQFSEDKTARQWIGLITKVIAMGIGGGLLNGLLWGDEDDWDEISDYTKDNYFLIPMSVFPWWEGKKGEWIKIPKGRVLAMFGVATDRILKACGGEAVEWGETFKTMADQVAPNNPFTDNLLSPLIDSRLLDPSNPGETWYGGNIESQRLQKYAPGERYDEKTDLISKTLGGLLNLSPKKINYIIKQYSGFVGSTILPFLTPSVERSILESNFVVDTTYQNNLSDSYYGELDKWQQAMNSSAAEGWEGAVHKYVNRTTSQKNGINDINAEIR
ncbi:MAG: hypothetical protein II503_01855, partial [Clostridia bacterium]|nr:hypothetical protein [Clostridia bacterium]